MKIDQVKLKEFQDRMSELYKKASDPKKKEITCEERAQGIKIAQEYYKFLETSGEAYGKAALQVVEDNGVFGHIANIHLRTQAVFEGHKPEYLPELRDRVVISLAHTDMSKRLALKDKFTYDTISEYHKDEFKKQDLSPYAWGGLVVEKILGPDKWMTMHDKDIAFFGQMTQQISKGVGTGKIEGYSIDRMVGGMMHSFRCLTQGEKPYAPVLRAGNAEQVAHWFDVDISRIQLLDVEEYVGDTPMVKSYLFKVWPQNHKIGPLLFTVSKEGVSLDIYAYDATAAEKKFKRAIAAKDEFKKFCNDALEKLQAQINKAQKDIQAKYQSEMDQKTKELQEQIDAELATYTSQKQNEYNQEAEARVEAIRASLKPGEEAIVDSSDIAARKQAELDEFKKLLENKFNKARDAFKEEVQQKGRKEVADIEKVANAKFEKAKQDAEKKLTIEIESIANESATNGGLQTPQRFFEDLKQEFDLETDILHLQGALNHLNIEGEYS